MTLNNKFFSHYLSRFCFFLFVSGLLCVLAAGLLAAPETTAKAWKILDTGMQEKSSEKRVQTLTALGLLLGDRKAVQAAERALADPNADVRAAAVTTLGEMNSRASVPKIKNLLTQPEGKIVVAVAAVLRKFNDPEGYEIYYEILTGERKTGGGILAGIKDKKSLEKMGFQEAVGFIPFGGVGLGAYNYFKQNDSSAVDVAAAAALANDPDPATTTALVQASFNSKELVQVAALRALARRGDPRVTNQIEPAMYSERSIVSYTAAAAVVRLTNGHSKVR